jgi:hypothetical protein
MAAGVSSVGLATEVVANSNSTIVVATANAFSNLSANGATYRVSGGGFMSPGQYGSDYIYPTVNVQIYVGGSGTSADPLVATLPLSPQGPANPGFIDGPVGHFSFDALVSMTANGVTAVGGKPSIKTLLVAPYGLQSNIAANGVVSGNFTGAGTNVANISIYAVAGPIGQNANLCFEHCILTAVTSAF